MLLGDSGAVSVRRFDLEVESKSIEKSQNLLERKFQNGESKRKHNLTTIVHTFPPPNSLKVV